MSYLELINNINKRYSCRNYSDKNVEKQDIIDVIEAARLSPSACNKQPWHFLIVTSEDKKNNLRKCYTKDWFKTAPTYIIALGLHNEAWHRPDDNKDHTDVDLSIATEHICLAAASKGLGTCWVCNFDVKLFKELFQLPDATEAIAIIPIGYPKEDKVPAKIRKNINDIIIWEEI